MIEKKGAAPGKGAAPESCDQPQHQETESRRTGAGEQTDWKDLPLDAEHVAMLVASGITPEQARLRGYQTISVLDRRRLHDFGFSQRVVNRAPGLLIPRRDVDGQVWGYQFRPDSPLRPDAGASAKYETRHGDPNALGVPDRVGEQRPRSRSRGNQDRYGRTSHVANLSDRGLGVGCVGPQAVHDRAQVDAA